MYGTQATATFAGPVSDDLLVQIAAQARDAEFQVEQTQTALILTAPLAKVVWKSAPTHLQVQIDAADAQALQNIRDYLLYILDHTAPGLGQAGDWQGDIVRNRQPLNFCTATVRSVRRVGPKFLRVELDCADTKRLATGRGMHFSLLLPPTGRAPIWPHLDGNGRTVLPKDADALHRAVYTFVDLDPAKGRFTFDVFEHEGGRATAWAQAAKPGETVGISGPGSGDFPPGQDILMAGDETAFPAIRRILQHSSDDRRGRVLLEVDHEEDMCDLPRPSGIELTWVIRARGETLWDHLASAPLPPGDDRFVWIAAEKELVRQAKARFRDTLGVGPKEGYFAYYWEA